MRRNALAMLVVGLASFLPTRADAQTSASGTLNETAACVFIHLILAYQIPDAASVMSPQYRARLTETASQFGEGSGVRSFVYNDNGIRAKVAARGARVIVYDIEIDAGRLPAALQRPGGLEEAFGRSSRFQVKSSMGIACDEYTLDFTLSNGILTGLRVGVAADLN